MVPHGLTHADLIEACIQQQRDLDVAEIFSGRGAVARAARRVGLKAAEYDIIRLPGITDSGDPATTEDILTKAGFLRACTLVGRLVMVVVVHVADKATTNLQVRGRSAVQGRASRKCYCRCCCGPLQTCTHHRSERYVGESSAQRHVQVRFAGRLFGRYTSALCSLPSLQILHRPYRDTILEEVQVHVQCCLGLPAPCGLRLPSWTPDLSQNSRCRRPP